MNDANVVAIFDRKPKRAEDCQCTDCKNHTKCEGTAKVYFDLTMGLLPGQTVPEIIRFYLCEPCGLAAHDKIEEQDANDQR